MVSCDRMRLPSLDDQVEEVAWGGDLGHRECRNGEVADNYGYYECVEIVCQEGGLDATDKGVQNHTCRQQENGGYHWHSSSASDVSLDQMEVETLK